MGVSARELAWENKKGSLRLPFLEASRGFEPLIRVLQTLALPLGHDALFIFCRPMPAVQTTAPHIGHNDLKQLLIVN